MALAELVDLHGRHGVDVLCVTDHVVRGADPCGPMVDEHTHPRYLAAIEIEAERALRAYGMILIPGLELTYSDPDPTAPHTRWRSASTSSCRSMTGRAPRCAQHALGAPRSWRRIPMPASWTQSRSGRRARSGPTPTG